MSCLQAPASGPKGLHCSGFLIYPAKGIYSLDAKKSQQDGRIGALRSPLLTFLCCVPSAKNTGNIILTSDKEPRQNNLQGGHQRPRQQIQGGRSVERKPHSFKRQVASRSVDCAKCLPNTNFLSPRLNSAFAICLTCTYDSAGAICASPLGISRKCSRYRPCPFSLSDHFLSIPVF